MFDIQRPHAPGFQAVRLCKIHRPIISGRNPCRRFLELLIPFCKLITWNLDKVSPHILSLQRIIEENFDALYTQITFPVN